jgi:hypothetical protein
MQQQFFYSRLSSFFRAALVALVLPGFAGCKDILTNTVAGDPPTSILVHATRSEAPGLALAYGRMSSRYRSAHRQDEFIRRLKGIPNLKQMDLPSMTRVEGSGNKRTVHGDIDLKNGSSVNWESITVMEDEATNAWRCDSLKVGTYAIE